MVKIDLGPAIQEAKDRNLGVKRNFTFRLPDELMKDFVAFCKRKDINMKPTEMLEILLKEVTRSKG